MELGADVRHVVAERVELSITEFATLEHLAKAAIGPAEIARQLNVSTAAATGIVDRLEAKGHAKRQPHPLDRRRQEVLITQHAREEVLRQMTPMFRAIGIADAQLTEQEREVVARYLRAAVEAATAVTAPQSGELAGEGHRATG